MMSEDHEGWNVLSRVILHIWQVYDYVDASEKDTWSSLNRAVYVLDYCRRLILVEEYPDSKNAADLLKTAKECLRGRPISFRYRTG